MPVTRKGLNSVFLAVSLACCSAVTLATPLNTNIIVNGDAEASLGAPDFGATSAPTGWSVTSNFSAVQYLAGGASDLNTADSTAVGGGTNYFAGGPTNPSASATQTINIGDLIASIDAGSLAYALSALIGGYAGQQDNIVVSVNFLDASSASLGLSSLGPVTVGDRSSLSELLPLATNGFVPVGTRSLEISMLSTRTEGSYNDGYADNVELVLRTATSVPEPSSISLLGLGLLGWLASGRKSRA